MIDTENYQDVRRVTYSNGPGDSDAVFLPICDQCGRFVKADPQINVHEWNGLADEPNATCSKHGRIKMIFEGFL